VKEEVRLQEESCDCIDANCVACVDLHAASEAAADEVAEIEQAIIDAT